MQFIEMSKMGYQVFQTTRGWAIGLTQTEAEAQEDLYQFPTKDQAQDGLEWSFEIIDLN